MPRGRFINRKIVDDYRLNSVPVEAELLYLKMITHLDREGRLQAEPKLINKKFYALRDFTDEQVEEWLNALWNEKKQGKGLIELYEVEGHKYLWMPGFWGEQTTGWQNTTYFREAPSEIPPPGVKAQPAKAPEPKEKQKPSLQVDEILDPKLAANVRYFQEKLGRIPSVPEFEQLKGMTDYPDGWFEKAVDEAVSYNKRNLRYIEKILERWQQEGHRSPEAKQSGKIEGLLVEE